ncbi:MAG TPA: hypothetical protein VHR39_14735, partial [Propionibacteriaceae bacterium]|nr:hypothetical protein [Propionibacteriaceae bacterium]
LLSGVREIVRQPTLRTLTLTSSLGQIGPGGLAVVAAVLATSQHRPAGSGLLLTAVAVGAFIGSLLWTWRPIAVDHAPLVTGISMIGIGIPIAIAAATPSLEATAVLFGLSGVFIGPFGSALFLARTQYAGPAVRTQVFTIGAGLKVTASALGAALIGFAAGLPAATQLILVASSPLLAGVLGTVLLTFRTSPDKAAQGHEFQHLDDRADEGADDGVLFHDIADRCRKTYRTQRVLSLGRVESPAGHHRCRCRGASGCRGGRGLWGGSFLDL